MKKYHIVLCSVFLFGFMGVLPLNAAGEKAVLEISVQSGKKGFYKPCSGTLEPCTVTIFKFGSEILLVTNKSTSIYAKNIMATLPAGWTDISQDASACTMLAPGSTCTLTFTSSDDVLHSAELVPVKGTNTVTAYVYIQVVDDFR
ncbi:hypothetical protein [Legionella spiritensis]|uniref:hypothetical protein n=1 Tax=Legionella spiritensis TaxID=452 RepID=UPI000F6FB76D|nr:hypothetical protein [Legionella spiritensis]VEG89609.1 transmembrane protein [Legionella spiritensis]